MDNIYKLMSEEIENKLLKNLSKDFPELSENEINKFIYKKTRNHYDFNKPNILYKNRTKGSEEEILDYLFPDNNKIINEWKTRLIKRYGKDKFDTYYLMIEYIKTFKNKTPINIDNNMNNEEKFKYTYKQVFQPFHNKENASRWKQKKFRLKKKMLSEQSPEDDYEYILFKFIQEMICK